MFLSAGDSSIYTDFYQLTMLQGYVLSGRKNDIAVFDYFFRNIPFEGGYAIFAGINEVAMLISNLQFDAAVLDYLAGQGMNTATIAYLKTFKFSGSIYAAREGEVVFAGEPLIRVEAPLPEAQLIETLLLNFVNFQTLIATKAARMRAVMGEDKIFIDMGLRRAQGMGALQASRAAFIGGANSTSNVLAGKTYGIPISGTQAHAWIQSFADELTAFRQYAAFYPDNTTLLVDTYDTLNSGVPNAITVAKELESSGHRLKSIRLDSGDLAWLSRQARQMLDNAGLAYVKIAASNSLDEHIIKSLQEQGACLDIYGVGTKLVTGDESPALDGVYKLCLINDAPRIKISENVSKMTLPDRKKIIRYTNTAGEFVADGIALAAEHKLERIVHPRDSFKEFDVRELQSEPLLVPVIENGVLQPLPTIQAAAAYAKKRLAQLPQEYKRFTNPHTYKVGASPALLALRDRLVRERKTKKENS